MKSSLLPRFALGRPVTVWMGLLATLVLGWVAWTQTPVQLMPAGFDYPFVWAWLPYGGSNPEEVERELLRPVEDQLETLPGIRSIGARASVSGAGFRIEFDQNVDMGEAWNGVVDRLERASLELPDDFERYYVYKYDPSDEPILWAALTIPEDADDPAYVIETRILRALERIPGIARAEYHGAPRARVFVDFNREAVERHRISLYQVMQDLGADNFALPSGELEDRGGRILVRSLATYEDLQAMAQKPIGDGLVLSDIADVVMGQPAATYVHRVNGARAASLDVFKESGANTVEVCRRVQEELEKLSDKEGLAGYTVHRFFDQGHLIQESIDNLRNSAIQGGGLAVLVLFAFLRRMGVTVLIALSIPLSLLMTLVVMYFRGDTINLLSMMGLMLSVGMVVDNSIVVVEAIYRRREEGQSSREAALGGTSEVALAILAATSTTLVVFLPLILMSDDAQFSFFMGKLGMPVCFALLSSLFVALILVPLVTARLVSEPPAEPSRPIAALTAGYHTLLRKVLTRRSSAFAVLILVLASLGYPMSKLRVSDSGDSGMVDFVVRAEFPGHFSFQQVREALLKIEAVVLDKKEEWRLRAVRTRRWGGSRRGFVVGMAHPREKGDLSKKEMEKAIEKLVPELPGVETWVGWRRDEGQNKQIEIRLAGDDSATLVRIGEEVVRRLESTKGVGSAEADLGEEGADELHVRVDRKRASRYGVSPQVLARTVSFAFRGTSLSPLVIQDREIPVQAGFRLEDRHSLRKLQDFGIWSTASGEVPLATVAATQVAKGFGMIRRRDRKTVLDVKVTLDDDDLGRGRELIAGALSSLKLPRGYSWNPGNRFERLEEQDRAQRFALMMSVAFVFLLMGMLFESFWTPVAVLLSIPFAFVGVYWMLYLTGTTLEVMAGIGLVILVGIVVNNAIVLVDRVQQQREAGLPRDEALLVAGRERLRPILMTAATTIVGLLPMAIGEANLVGMPYYPLGRAVIGGLLASTVLSLLLVPLFYTYLDDFKHLLIRAFRPKPPQPTGTLDEERPVPSPASTAGLVFLASSVCLGLSMPGSLSAAPAEASIGLESAVEGESSTEQGSPLGLSQALELALLHNLGLRARASDLAAARSRLRASWGPFMPTLNASWNISPSQGERWLDQFKSWERSSGDTGSYTVGLGARMLTGTTLNLSWTQGGFNQATAYDPEVIIDNPLDPDHPIEVLADNEFHTRWAAVTLGVTQNLLRGISPLYQRAPVDQARLGQDSAAIEQDQETADVAARVLKAYWDLVAARRNVSIQKLHRELAENQRSVTEARIAAGELAPIELLRIDETVASRFADVLEAERLAADADQALRSLLGDPPDEVADLRPLLPVDGIVSTLPERHRAGSLDAALGRNPGLLLQRGQLEAQKIEWRSARHELLPVVDLNASLALNGTGFDVEESVQDVFDRRYPDFEVGMTVQVPLPDVAAIHTVKTRDHEIKAALLRLQAAEMEVIFGVERAIRAVASFEKQVEVSRLRRDLAEQTAGAAEATYQAGRNTLRDVLEAQASLKDAKQAVVTAQVAALGARVDLELLRGTLLEALDVVVE